MAASLAAAYRAFAHDEMPESQEPHQASEEANLLVHGEKKEMPSSASSTVRAQDVLSIGLSKTGSDALRMVPGMAITQHSGFGKAHQYYFRGFDAAHGQDIEFNVAGIPVNDVSNVHGQGYSDLHFVIPETVREIRSTPGSYRGEQGDFAVAGSMRYELGLARPGAMIRAGAGSFGTERIFAAFRPESMSQDTFVAFDQQSTRGLGTQRAASSASFLGQTTLALGEKANLRVFFGSYFSNFQSPGVLLQDDVELDRASFDTSYDPKQGGRSTRHQALVEWTQTSEKQKLSVSSYAVARGFSLRQNYTGYTFDARANAFRSDNTEQIQDGWIAGAKARLERKMKLLSDEDRWIFGVATQTTQMDQRQSEFEIGTDRVSSSILDAKVHVTNVSGYVDMELHPVSPLRIHGGVRLDTYFFSATDRATTDRAASRYAQGVRVGPKLSAELQISKGALLSASFGEGFRSPQARSVYDGQTVEFTRVTNVEVGSRVHTDPKTKGAQLDGSIAFFGSLLSQ
ncbi:MAG: TonB-dependent receptor, partial [Polyangiaceae bacterium]|nr:TonB-dependent receptor [Polyangiaceae bacterium]